MQRNRCSSILLTKSIVCCSFFPAQAGSFLWFTPWIPINASSGPFWSLGTRTSLRFPTWVLGSKEVKLFSTAYPGPFKGSRIGGPAARTENMRDAGLTRGSSASWGSIPDFLGLLFWSYFLGSFENFLSLCWILTSRTIICIGHKVSFSYLSFQMTLFFLAFIVLHSFGLS